MAAFSSIIAGIGAATTLAGTAVGVVGQMQSISASKKAEKLRKQQMDLDSARERREIARRAILARSQALTAGADQGATYGSGLAGGLAQITGEQARSTVAVNQNQTIGAGIFRANAQRAQGESIQSFGQGLQGFGGMLMDNSQLFGRVGAYYGIGG